MPKDGYAPAIGGTGVGPGPAVPFGRRERQPSSSGDPPTAAEGGSAAVRAAAYFFRVSRSAANPGSRWRERPLCRLASEELGGCCHGSLPYTSQRRFSEYP